MFDDTRSGRLWLLLLSAGLNLASLPAAASSSVPTPNGAAATTHLRAAERQAVGDESLKAAFARWCLTSSSAPETAALAVRRLGQAEADHQAERALPRPRANRLLLAVVLRSCAAFHATRLQPGASYPVWLHTQIRIEGSRPTAAGLEMQARATTVDGAVANSRITFSRGLHHACFASTDATGKATCTMVDTHPHSEGGMGSGWAEAHEGPVVATLAGSVSASRVELPAVGFLDLPVFGGVSPLR